MIRRIFSSKRPAGRVLVITTAFVLLAVSAYSQGAGLGGGLDPKVLDELKYVEQLNNWGMADYAQVVLEKLAGIPGIEVHLKRLKIQTFIAVGKFDEVDKIIAKEPNQDGPIAWGLKLAKADGYYSWGKYQEAQALYDAFFLKYPGGPSPDLNDFYMESAYKYAQMLLLMGKRPEAMMAYKNILKAKLPAYVERQVWAETAEIILTVADETEDVAKRDAMIKEVEDLCGKILWVQDLWFGKAIVYLAHIEVIRDKPENAEKLIKEYKGQLEDIDRSLQESAKDGDDLTKLSPMAQCRYLIGTMMQDVAIKELKKGNKQKAIDLLLGKDLGKGQRTNGALHHFINVFVRYPSTSWAPDAGVRVDDIKRIAVEDLGAKEITFKITPDQWEAVRKAQFLEARTLFNRQMFQQAVDSYIKVLNLFPEGDTSVAAISELARCFVETKQELEADTTIKYLAECFSKKADTQALAGDKIIGLAAMYEGLGDQDKKDEIYNIYFDYFTTHSRAPAMLFQFGERKLDEENYAEALGYFSNIIKNHKTSNLYTHSLYKASTCYGKMGKQVAEIKLLQELITTLEKEPAPDILLLTSKFSVAQGYRQLAKDMLAVDTPEQQQTGNKYMMAAAGKYVEIINILSQPTHPFKATADNAKFSSTVLEGSLFFKAYCYMLLTLPSEKVGQYKGLAIKGYQELVDKFPKSIYAPQALSQVATLYSLYNKADEAQAAIRQLKKDYPDAPESDNVDFMLGMNLLKMGRKREAIIAFKNMIKGEGKYTARKILIAGTELIKPGVELYDIGLEAFEKALTMSEDRNITEPARLGQGQSLTELGQFEKATEILDKLMVDFPSSGYTVDTGFYLARAASAHAMTLENEDARFDMFNKAMAALKRVRKFAGDDLGLKAKTDLEIGLIMEKKAEAEKKFGAEDKRIKYMEDAIGAYQVMMMFSDARNPVIRPHVDDAYKQCINLMFDLEKWADVLQDADKYLKQFPSGKNVSFIRSLKNKATVKQRIAGGEIAVDAGTGLEEPVAEEQLPEESENATKEE